MSKDQEEAMSPRGGGAGGSPKGGGAGGKTKEFVSWMKKAFNKSPSPKRRRFLSLDSINSPPSKPQVFGVSLEKLAVGNTHTVPFIVRKIVEHIEENGLTEQGLYRVNGNTRLINDLRNTFDKTGDADFSCVDTATVGGLLKLWLRELPTPVIPDDVVPEFVEIQETNVGHASPESRLAQLREAIHKLPEVNYELLKYLIRHLIKVTKHSAENKMASVPLSIVFGPCIFRCGSGLQGLKDQGYTNSAVCRLIQNYEDIFEHDASPLMSPAKTPLEGGVASQVRTTTDLGGSAQSRRRFLSLDSGKPQVFGVSLEKLAVGNTHTVPFIVRKIVEHIEENGLAEEGLYRVNGSTKLMNDLRITFDKKGDADFSYVDVATVGGLLKLWLRELPTPVIPDEIAHEFVEIQETNVGHTSPERLAQLREAIHKLPEVNYELLKYLIRHLIKVTKHSAENKMASVPLSIVFGPSIFRCGSGLQGLKDQGYTNSAVCRLIQNYEDIFEPSSNASPVDPGTMSQTKTPLQGGVASSHDRMAGGRASKQGHVPITSSSGSSIEGAGQVPTSKGTMGTEPTTKGTMGTEPTSKGTMGTVPTTKGTMGTVPTTKGTMGTEPTTKGTMGTEPTTKGTMGTVPTTKGTMGTEPTTKGTMGTEPTTKGTMGTEPTTKGTMGTEPTTKGTMGTEPTTKGTMGTEPTSKGTMGTEPTTKGTMGTVPTTKGTMGTEPTTKGLKARTSVGTGPAAPLDPPADAIRGTLVASPTPGVGSGSTSAAMASVKTVGHPGTTSPHLNGHVRSKDVVGVVPPTLARGSGEGDGTGEEVDGPMADDIDEPLIGRDGRLLAGSKREDLSSTYPASHVTSSANVDRLLATSRREGQSSPSRHKEGRSGSHVGASRGTQASEEGTHENASAPGHHGRRGGSSPGGSPSQVVRRKEGGATACRDATPTCEETEADVSPFQRQYAKRKLAYVPGKGEHHVEAPGLFEVDSKSPSTRGGSPWQSQASMKRLSSIVQTCVDLYLCEGSAPKHYMGSNVYGLLIPHKDGLGTGQGTKVQPRPKDTTPGEQRTTPGEQRVTPREQRVTPGEHQPSTGDTLTGQAKAGREHKVFRAGSRSQPELSVTSSGGGGTVRSKSDHTHNCTPDHTIAMQSDLPAAKRHRPKADDDDGSTSQPDPPPTVRAGTISMTLSGTISDLLPGTLPGTLPGSLPGSLPGGDSLRSVISTMLAALEEKRKKDKRPYKIWDMTPQQLQTEKHALQRALLQFEKKYGKPVSKDDKELVRPLYERYRDVKRLHQQNERLSTTCAF